jgi:hypothetical protein
MIYTYFTLTQWEEITDRGTSGDQVHDILAAWKYDRDTLRAEVARLEQKLAEAASLMSANGWEWPHDLTPTSNLLTDGFGNYWSQNCPDCGAPMQVVRPGDARCSAECYTIDDRIKEEDETTSASQ